MKKLPAQAITTILMLTIFLALACKKDDDNDSQKPVVQTLEVVNISPESGLGGGNITSDGSVKITSRGLVWSLTESPTISNNDGMSDEGKWAGEFHSQMFSLLPATRYFVRAYAENRHGLIYGNQVSFTTLEANTAADIDGNIYKTTQIGEQEWFADNLRVTHFSEGTLIAGNLSLQEWYSDLTPGYRIYPHENIEGIYSDNEMLSAYGLLYNGYAAINEKGLCPRAGGWRVATYDDWNKLNDFVQTQQSENTADRLKCCLQVNSPLGGNCSTNIHPRWDYDSEHHGTNDYRFSALPAGFLSWTGPFQDLGNTGIWWCADMNPQTGYLNYIFLRSDWGVVTMHNADRRNGFSVRCMRDIETTKKN